MRRFIARTPIWVRVSGIIALVLVGVIGTTMAVGAGRDGGGGHGSGDGMRGGDHERGAGTRGGDHGSRGGMQGRGHESDGGMRGGDHESGGGIQGGGDQSGGGSQTRDHSGGQAGSAAATGLTPDEEAQRLVASANQGTASTARTPAAESTRTGRSCLRRPARRHHGGARDRCRRPRTGGHHR
jgi:hypothetical protein